MGLINIEKYQTLIDVELKFDNKILAGLIAGGEKGENAQRVMKRIELIEKELKEIAEMANQQEEQKVENPEPVEKPIQSDTKQEISQQNGKKAKVPEKPQIAPPVNTKEPSKNNEKIPELKKMASGVRNPNSLIISQPSIVHMNLEKVDNKAYAQIQERIGGYKEAILYLQNSGLNERAEKLIEGYDKLSEECEKIMRGQKTNELNWPPKIGPALVLGMTHEKRIEGIL